MFKVALENPIQVGIKIEGVNQFDYIDCIYLKEPGKNELAQFFFYFRGVFIKECQLQANNVSNTDKLNNEDNPEEAENQLKSAIGLFLFNERFDERLNKIHSLLSSVAFKDKELSQSLILPEITKLSLEDLQEVASSFLSKYWATRWLKQIAKASS
jgi:hypothetical protein